MPLGWEVTLWPHCSHLRHCPFLVASCRAHTSFVQNHPSSPAISSLSRPPWIALVSSQLCFCTRSKYLPSGAQTFLPCVPAHSWDDRTRELISTTFSTAASSLEHVQFYLIFLLPPKHGILSGLFISLMDTKKESILSSLYIHHPAVSIHGEENSSGSCCYCFV